MRASRTAGADDTFLRPRLIKLVKDEPLGSSRFSKECFLMVRKDGNIPLLTESARWRV